jgi:HD-GYP domain-containing protein (c-di-GMP phosphodiesterase class II)
MQPEDTIYNTLCKYTKALTVALGYRDQLTQLHSERVLGLSEQLGIKCGLSDEQLGTLKIAASFHDIGKIGIPDPVLLKPSRFDAGEWLVMKKHPQIGAEIMLATGLEGAKQAAEIIRCHHEHFDGSGYPDGQSGENISILARIISIADAYDAMAMTRCYHRARTHQEIMIIIAHETGKKFDPKITALFGQLIETSQYKAKPI